MDSIAYINPPFVFTAQGKRHELKDIQGTPRVGAVIDDTLTIVGNANDSECVGGVCPIK